MKRDDPATFHLDDLPFDSLGYMNREPKRLADVLAARGMPGDTELADLFRNFGDTLPATLQRMTRAIEAMDGMLPLRYTTAGGG